MNATGKNNKPPYRGWALAFLAGAASVALLVIGTLRDPNFWLTTEQHGDALVITRREPRTQTVVAIEVILALADRMLLHGERRSRIERLSM